MPNSTPKQPGTHAKAEQHPGGGSVFRGKTVGPLFTLVWFLIFEEWEGAMLVRCEIETKWKSIKLRETMKRVAAWV